MATVTELKRKIGRITRRESDVNFPQDSLDGLNEGLQEIYKIHPPRDAISTVSISVLEGATSATITGTPLTVKSIRASKASNDYCDITIRSKDYLNRVYPNREDTAQSAELISIARVGTTLYFNGSVNSDYTLKVEQFSTSTLLTALTSSPNELYDQALIHYSCYWIFGILEQEPQANRQLELYQRALQLTIRTDSRDIGTTYKMGVRALMPRQSSMEKPDYLSSDLETLYGS